MKLNKKQWIIIAAALAAVIIAIVVIVVTRDAEKAETDNGKKETGATITEGEYYGYSGLNFYKVTLKDNQYTFESGSTVGEGTFTRNDDGSLELSDRKGTLNPNWNGYEHVYGYYDCQYYYVAPGLYYSEDNLLKRSGTSRDSFLHLNEEENTYFINRVGATGYTFNYDPEAKEQYVSVIHSGIGNDFVLYIKDGNVTQYVCDDVWPLRYPVEDGIDDDYYREVTSSMKNSYGQPFTGLFDEHYEDLQITYSNNVTTLIGDGEEIIRMVVAQDELRFEYPESGKTLVFYADEAKARETRK